VCGLL